MTWTLTNLIIEIIAGILGGHAAAIAAKEHAFGALGHTVVGALGGGLSGYFLQTLVNTMVTITGSLNQPRVADVFMLQSLAGLASGAAAMLVVGFIKHSIDNHKPSA